MTALRLKVSRWNCGDAKNCELCGGEKQMVTYEEMFDHCVCQPAVKSTNIGDLAADYPKEPCLSTDCENCGGQYQLLPPCQSLRLSQAPVTVNEYEYVTRKTRDGKDYQALELVKKSFPVSQLWEKMNSGPEDPLRHHFRASWINKMIEHLRARPNQGQLQIYIDFPERQELGARAAVAKQEYHKRKILLLVLALTWTCVGEATQKSHCCCYIGDGSLDKSQGVIEEAIQDAVTWAMRKGGVAQVLYLSDRARREFSNASIMMWLSNHEKKFGLGAEWMFTEPDHGKSDCDGLGAGIKTMLYEWFGTLESMPTPHECVQFLWDHTKEVPIRGKYAKYKEYRFQVLEGKKPTTHAAETIKGITKSFHWKSIGKPNHVMARTLPCFCDLCKAKCFDACKNKGYVGSWQPIEVKRK